MNRPNVVFDLAVVSPPVCSIEENLNGKQQMLYLKRHYIQASMRMMDPSNSMYLNMNLSTN